MQRRLLVFLLSVAAALPARAATWYVATIGSDTNPGSPTAPFKTVARALAAAGNSNASIEIRAGNYGSDHPRIIQPVHIVNWGGGASRIGAT